MIQLCLTFYTLLFSLSKKEQWQNIEKLQKRKQSESFDWGNNREKEI